MSKRRSWVRWVLRDDVGADKPGYAANIYKQSESHPYKADLILRHPKCVDVDCPPVGTEMMWGGERVTVESGPIWDGNLKRVEVVVRESDHMTHLRPLSDLTPIPQKSFIARYPADSEDEAREKYGIPDGVKLEES